MSFINRFKMDILMLSILSIATFLMLITYASAEEYNKDISEYELVDTVQIYNLNTVLSNTGNFFLGTGTVKNELRYYYEQRTKEGNKIIDYIPTERTIIMETDNADSTYIEIYQSDSKLNLDTPNKYKVYIPKGSINKEFNINLK